MTQPATGAPETGEPNTTADPPTPETDETDWKAEAEKHKADVEKWKAMSRKNEADLKAERDKAAKATMTADEKAVADAEAKGRKEALKAAGERLAAAEFRSALAEAGVSLGEAASDIDMRKFVGDDGEPDMDAIGKAVKRFAKLAPKAPTTPGKSGGDFSGGTGAGQPISEAQLRAMSEDDIAKALVEGRLNHLL